MGKILSHSEALELAYAAIGKLRENGVSKITITEVSRVSGVNRSTINSKNPEWVEVRNIVKNNLPLPRVKLAEISDTETIKWQFEARKLEKELDDCKEQLGTLNEQADLVFNNLLNELHKYVYLAKKTPDEIQRESNILIELKELKERCEYYEKEIDRVKNSHLINDKTVPFVKKEVVSIYTEIHRMNISDIDMLEVTYDALLNLNQYFDKKHPPNTVYILVGNFASGKSTWIEKHKAHIGGTVLYLDGTNHTKSIRKMIIKYIRNLKSDCKIVCVRMLCDKNVCLKRNANESRKRLNIVVPESIINLIGDNFEEISLYEGFNEIIIGGVE